MAGILHKIHVIRCANTEDAYAAFRAHLTALVQSQKVQITSCYERVLSLDGNSLEKLRRCGHLTADIIVIFDAPELPEDQIAGAQYKQIIVSSGHKRVLLLGAPDKVHLINQLIKNAYKLPAPWLLEVQARDEAWVAVARAIATAFPAQMKPAARALPVRRVRNVAMGLFTLAAGFAAVHSQSLLDELPAYALEVRSTGLERTLLGAQPPHSSSDAEVKHCPGGRIELKLTPAKPHRKPVTVTVRNLQSGDVLPIAPEQATTGALWLAGRDIFSLSPHQKIRIRIELRSAQGNRHLAPTQNFDLTISQGRECD